MKKVAVVFGLFILMASNIRSQEKLEPAKSVFDGWNIDYYKALREILVNRNDERFDFRYFVMPSFEKEYFWGLKRMDSVWYVTYRVPEEQIWSSGKFFQKETFKNYSVDITEIKRQISPESASMLAELFLSAVLNAEFAEPTPEGIDHIRGDGTNYYFSVWDTSLGYRTATIWSPTKGSYTRRLVEILEEVVRQVVVDEKMISLNPDLKERIARLTAKYPLPVGSR